MTKQFQSNLHKIVAANNRILLAVSGGVDSMVMAELFLKSGWNFGVAHCNYTLRSEESDKDERLVENWCSSNQIPFFKKRFETQKISQQLKKGIQETARDLRYEFFDEICNEQGYDLIATAHHKNDSIETVLFNFSRGTGLTGLTGIKSRKGKIIRPLLPFSKIEILAYAEKNKIEFREDSSNSSNKYSRNYLRNEVVPKLKNLNADFENNISNSIERLESTNEIFQFFIKKVKDEICHSKEGDIHISKIKIKELPQPASILFELIRPFGFNFSQAKDILSKSNSQPGAIFYSPTFRLLNDRAVFILSEINEQGKLAIELFQESEIQFEGNNLTCSKKEVKERISLDVNPKVAILDADKLKFPLTIENWKPGDRFCPIGMDGKSKKVKDFLSDLKIDRFEKERVYVLKSEGKICWVIGYRIDENFKLSSSTTATYTFKFS